MTESQFKNKIKRQDSKYKKKYKPVTTGLPKGFTRSQWWFIKHKDKKEELNQSNSSARLSSFYFTFNI